MPAVVGGIEIVLERLKELIVFLGRCPEHLLGGDLRAEGDVDSVDRLHLGLVEGSHSAEERSGLFEGCLDGRMFGAELPDFSVEAIEAGRQGAQLGLDLIQPGFMGDHMLVECVEDREERRIVFRLGGGALGAVLIGAVLRRRTERFQPILERFVPGIGQAAIEDPLPDERNVGERQHQESRDKDI